MSRADVSVIIPAWNALRWIAAAIDSALAQTHAPREVIVVDDGSTDDTAAFVASHFPDVRLLRQPNRGLAAARNAGLACAAGNFVQFLDADDVLLPTKLERQLEVFEAQPACAAVYCDFAYLEADGRRTPSGLRGRFPSGRILLPLLRRNFIVAHAPVLRTDSVRALGGFAESLTACEDYDLWLRLAAAGHRFACVPEALALYRRTPGSMSDDRRRQVEQTRIVLARVVESRALGPLARLVAFRHQLGLALHARQLRQSAGVTLPGTIASTAASDGPRVSVVIPTWNGRDMLRHALRSLAAQTFTAFETIVVDNGSTDDTAGMLSAEFPGVRLQLLPENRGFATAVNEGMRSARGDIIVLMNNDTEADRGWLAALVRALDAHPDVGSCMSKMVDHADASIIDSAGIQLGLFASNIGEGARDAAEFQAARRIFGACAGAAAYRRRALHDVGLMDESFFAYMEDVDLAARLQLAGHACLYVPDAVIRHRGSATAARMPELRFFLQMRNSITVFLRYAPLPRLLWAPLVLAWPFVRAIADGQRIDTACRAVAHALRDLPSVLRLRRHVRSTRRLSGAAFHTLLAPPLTRAGRKPVPARRATAPQAWPASVSSTSGAGPLRLPAERGP